MCLQHKLQHARFKRKPRSSFAHALPSTCLYLPQTLPHASFLLLLSLPQARARSWWCLFNRFCRCTDRLNPTRRKHLAFNRPVKSVTFLFVSRSIARVGSSISGRVCAYGSPVDKHVLTIRIARIICGQTWCTNRKDRTDQCGQICDTILGYRSPGQTLLRIICARISYDQTYMHMRMIRRVRRITSDPEMHAQIALIVRLLVLETCMFGSK